MLGICVGMQALFDYCEEDGGIDGLGLFQGSVRHFSNFHTDSSSRSRLKIPQMGWNQVHQLFSHPLWKDIKQDSRFYFVHSYYAEPKDKAVTAATTDYQHDFTSALCKDNIFAAQFHPEKSQHDGLQLLQNFLNWDGQS